MSGRKKKMAVAYQRGTRGLRRWLEWDNPCKLRRYIPKEVQEDLKNTIKETAKEYSENLPVVDLHFDLVMIPVEVKQ